jgi:hypothetical protein
MEAGKLRLREPEHCSKAAERTTFGSCAGSIVNHGIDCLRSHYSTMVLRLTCLCNLGLRFENVVADFLGLSCLIKRHSGSDARGGDPCHDVGPVVELMD